MYTLDSLDTGTQGNAATSDMPSMWKSAAKSSSGRGSAIRVAISSSTCGAGLGGSLGASGSRSIGEVTRRRLDTRLESALGSGWTFSFWRRAVRLSRRREASLAETSVGPRDSEGGGGVVSLLVLAARRRFGVLSLGLALVLGTLGLSAASTGGSTEALGFLFLG